MSSAFRTFDFTLETGEISNRRVFRDTHGHPGKPDGSAVDVEGCLCNCEYGGGRIVRYDPSGQIDRVIPLPVANPTCCAFGGGDLRTLFVTSAAQRLTPDELAEQPLAGSVFAIQTPAGSTLWRLNVTVNHDHIEQTAYRPGPTGGDWPNGNPTFAR